MLSITTGCMYAGKTTKLINDIPTSGVTLVVDYEKDKLPYAGTLSSHDNTTVNCIRTGTLSSLSTLRVDTILINEAQFFEKLKTFTLKNVLLGKTVLIYGLDGDFKQNSFGEILDLIPHCDTFTKLYAKCSCGSNASFSKRLTKNSEQYGPHDTYVAVCRKCY